MLCHVPSCRAMTFHSTETLTLTHPRTIGGAITMYTFN